MKRPASNPEWLAAYVEAWDTLIEALHPLRRAEVETNPTGALARTCSRVAYRHANKATEGEAR